MLTTIRNQKLELSSYDGCLLWGSRVIVPHEGHPGMTKMKSLARMYVWWPRIDDEIENSVRLCRSCQSTPAPAPLNPWQWLSRPWSRLRVDFAGLLMGKTLLNVIDAHSKWIDASVVATTSSYVVIERLRGLFAMFGIPETLVSDNGCGFVSQEFRTLRQLHTIPPLMALPKGPYRL